jgi:hypothetical protein
MMAPQSPTFCSTSDRYRGADSKSLIKNRREADSRLALGHFESPRRLGLGPGGKSDMLLLGSHIA